MLLSHVIVHFLLLEVPYSGSTSIAIRLAVLTNQENASPKVVSCKDEDDEVDV